MIYLYEYNNLQFRIQTLIHKKRSPEEVGLGLILTTVRSRLSVVICKNEEKEGFLNMLGKYNYCCQ